jgi:deoxyribodipyrimidine photo-lyase
MPASNTIVWFRHDLRLHDNPALTAAVERDASVIPIFVLDETAEGDWPHGGAARWWLHHSLASLDASLRRRGSRLTFLRGPGLEAIRSLIARTDARAVHWNRRYEPTIVARDIELKRALQASGIEARRFNGALLCEPQAIQNQHGHPYRVYSAFRRSLLEHLHPTQPLPAPRVLPTPKTLPASLALDALELMPRVDWYDAMAAIWQPGEAGALAGLKLFLARPIANYGASRDCPSIEATSRLSPHLHFGEVSARRVWHAGAVASERQGMSGLRWRDSTFVSELIWREFAHHLLFHFPHTQNGPLDRRFARFPWTKDNELLRAWQRGLTGFPFVDAGMRQLWASGWMHNRVRMIVASLLVKNLRIHWLEGARWFWDTLVDADLAANTLNWQWVAGCGADAAPYFRIFNPVAQGAKFDPEGDYVRRWVPELARLPTKHIHAPWLASESVLAAANVRLGKDYPRPITDLKESRENALAVYRAI